MAVTERIERNSSPLAEYSPHEHRPLRSYAVMVSAYGVALGATVLAGRAAGHEAPARIGLGDLLLMGIATHKVSRSLAKDKVMGFVRAPFTEFQESSGQGEVEERPRGTGAQKAIGELLVCPYCLAHWVATGFVAGHVLAPRATRLVASTYTIETLSDFLQLAYHAAEERA